MTEIKLREKVAYIIQKLIQDGELKENILHVSPNDKGVVTGVKNDIENIFPGYDEKTGVFAPQKVIDKTY